VTDPDRADAQGVPPPRDACDAHTHVFAHPKGFPFGGGASYPLPEAPYARHRAMLDAAGMSRGVLVQPAPYGEDHSALLAALARSDGRLRGVGLISSRVSEDALALLASGGVRGARFVESRQPDGSRYPGSVGFDGVSALGSRLRDHRLHIEVWSAVEDLVCALPTLESAGVPVVLDHMGGFDPAKGIEDRGFQCLLCLVRDARVWVKLTLTRRSRQRPAFADLRPFHDALVQANPRQLVWGSDWPFVRMEPPPCTEELLGLFTEWVDDDALRQAILVENPARLYNFGDLP
jgi:2-pyrone-4,6-dicarboxylate lactonase